jgi:hypothetical protein
MSELGMKVGIILGLSSTFLVLFFDKNCPGTIWRQLMAEYHLGGRRGCFDRYGAGWSHASALRLSLFARTLDKKMAFG